MRRLLALAAISALLPCSALAGFSDTTDYPWHHSIDLLSDLDIVEGYGDGTYQPLRLLNRAELTKIVVEALFEPEEFADSADDCFPDVKQSDWFSKYVCFAKEMGIVAGHGDGLFHPGDPITQPAALKIVLKAFYDDIPEPGEHEQWYDTYLDEADYLGMLYFAKDSAPSHQVTRGEMAYFMAWNLEDEPTDQIDFDEFDGDFTYDDDELFDWETMTPDECEADEQYDAEDEMCYVICEEWDDDCFEWEDDFEFFEGDEGDLWEDDEEWQDDEGFPDAWEDEDDWLDDEGDYGDWYDDVYDDDFHGFDDHEPEDPENSAVYNVNGDTITLSDKGIQPTAEDTAVHQQIWQKIVNLVPKQYRSNIKQLQLFTDGLDGTQGYVDSDDGGNWTLGIDTTDATSGDAKDFTLTIIHEYGHILTLNNEQVDRRFEDSEDGDTQCAPHYYTGEGCAKPGSFINLFFKKFWGGKLIKEQRKLEESYAFEEDGGETLYAKYPSQFVTEYAASNVAEDIAESFSYFVFKEKPTGSSVKDQKVQFFYQFPSLVTLRSEMRKGMRK